jgi:hypothetical protein
LGRGRERENYLDCLSALLPLLSQGDFTDWPYSGKTKPDSTHLSEPTSFPCSTATFGEGAGHRVAEIAQPFVVWAGRKGRGLGEKERGCGKPREGLAQLDFFRNFNSSYQNGGIAVEPNSTDNLTIALQVSLGKEKPNQS